MLGGGNWRSQAGKTEMPACFVGDPLRDAIDVPRVDRRSDLLQPLDLNGRQYMTLSRDVRNGTRAVMRASSTHRRFRIVDQDPLRLA